MEQAQSLPNKEQPKKKQQQSVVTHPVESEAEPQVGTKEENMKGVTPPVESEAEPQVGAKEETKKAVKVGNMTITYN